MSDTAVPETLIEDYYGKMARRVAEALRDAGAPCDRHTCLRMARSAILAMREPTEKMETDGIAYVQTADDGTGESWDYVAGTWATMIDAALKEEG